MYSSNMFITHPTLSSFHCPSLFFFIISSTLLLFYIFNIFIFNSRDSFLIFPLYRSDRAPLVEFARILFLLSSLTFFNIYLYFLKYQLYAQYFNNHTFLWSAWSAKVVGPSCMTTNPLIFGEPLPPSDSHEEECLIFIIVFIKYIFSY